jgi:hypothetical protein
MQALAPGTKVKVKDGNYDGEIEATVVTLEEATGQLAIAYEVSHGTSTMSYTEAELDPQPGMRVLQVDYL